MVWEGMARLWWRSLWSFFVSLLHFYDYVTFYLHHAFTVHSCLLSVVFENRYSYLRLQDSNVFVFELLDVLHGGAMIDKRWHVCGVVFWIITKKFVLFTCWCSQSIYEPNRQASEGIFGKYRNPRCLEEKQRFEKGRCLLEGRSSGIKFMITQSPGEAGNKRRLSS